MITAHYIKLLSYDCDMLAFPGQANAEPCFHFLTQRRAKHGLFKALLICGFAGYSCLCAVYSQRLKCRSHNWWFLLCSLSNFVFQWWLENGS